MTISAWSRFDGSDDAWDELVAKLAAPSFYQLAAWARVEQAQGFKIIRLYYRDQSGHILAAVQGRLRLLPLGGVYLLCRGGIAGKAGAEPLLPALLNLLLCRYGYVRLASFAARTAEAVTELRASAWQPAMQAVHTGLSLTLDLGPEFTSLLTASSGNWRHNLKRGLKRCPAIELWEDPSPEAIMQIYQSMESFKGLRAQWTLPELSALLHEFRSKLFVFRASNAAGTVIALRAYLDFAPWGIDLLAANSPEGREVYAAHAILNTLLEHCQQRGLSRYDLSGIDPHGGAGVYHFKRGTGALPYEYLGEWEQASHPLLRILWNAALSWKLRPAKLTVIKEAPVATTQATVQSAS